MASQHLRLRKGRLTTCSRRWRPRLIQHSCSTYTQSLYCHVEKSVCVETYNGCVAAGCPRPAGLPRPSCTGVSQRDRQAETPQQATLARPFAVGHVRADHEAGGHCRNGATGGRYAAIACCGHPAAQEEWLGSGGALGAIWQWWFAARGDKMEGGLGGCKLGEACGRAGGEQRP